VGLTDAERREYYGRQERIRDLDAEISKFRIPPPSPPGADQSVLQAPK
jgi:hypothetical protein